MQDQTDLYEILQVHPAAEQEVIDVAFRRLARMYHPDVNSSPDANERMKALNLAYEILGDPAKRADYDRQHGKRANYNRPRGNSAEYTRQRASREQNESQAREEYKLPFGEAVLKGMLYGVMYSIISTAVFFLLDLIGWTTVAAWIVGIIAFLLAGLSLWAAIVGPFGISGGFFDARPPHPRMLIRFVKAFLSISFVLTSFYVTLLIWVQFAEASSILVVGISSFILGTAFGIVAGLYDRDFE